MKLKTFESFEIDNSKIWVVGVPSGEAFQVSRDSLDILYQDGMVFYNTKYSQTGFYTFDDNDVKVIKRYVDPKVIKALPKEDKDMMIYDHNFDEMVTDTVLNLVDEYPESAELYMSNNLMGITYGNTYIEISINDADKAGKYTLTKRRKGVVIDKYVISNDNHLINRIDNELYKK